MFKKEFNNITFNKNVVFKMKKENICSSMKINYFVKKNAYSSFKKARHKELFYVMMKFESCFGLVPQIKKINIKIKNKKKKVFSVNYIYMSLFINKNLKLFFDLFFVKNSLLLLFEIFSRNKFFNYSQELNFKQFYVKFLMNNNTLLFNFNLSSILLSENVLEILEKYKRNVELVFNVQFFFFGLNSKYILNFLNVFTINYNKLLIFFYKYFKNKIIRI